MHPELRSLDRRLRHCTRPVRIWWRDDDAGATHPGLDRLLGIARHRGVPLALAVVPGWLDGTTQGLLAGHPRATIWQHGWQHRDHAEQGSRKIELGGRVDAAELARNLARGRKILEDSFGSQFQPVMVPPWNRIAPEIERLLPDLGYAALSTIATHHRGGESGASALPRLDVDLDLIRWGDRPGSLPLPEIAERLAALLDRAGPPRIGLMTHHRVMSEAAFTELETLLSFLIAHPLVRLVPADVIPASGEWHAAAVD
jgi:hypothetical protein